MQSIFLLFYVEYYEPLSRIVGLDYQYFIFIVSGRTNIAWRLSLPIPLRVMQAGQTEPIPKTINYNQN